MISKYNILIACALLVTGCIGTDEIDDPIVGSSIEVDQIQISLLVGDSGKVTGTYFNQYGLEDNIQILWESNDPTIATVDISGLVIGQAAGQTNVNGAVGNTDSEPVLITVVKTIEEVAMVAISSNQGQHIAVDQELQLDISVTNLLGEVLDGLDVLWVSSNTDVLTVSSEGLVKGIGDGYAQIFATVEGIKSNQLGIMVGTTSRTGTFQGDNGYNASGTTEFFIADNGDLMLSLSDDFETDFALGTFVYLSNSTSGTTTAAAGLEIAGISENGGAVFNVSNVDPGVTINDFDYVIILCKPATITFGFAQLN